MKMPCESCSVQFSVFKRKRACPECDRYYCSSCLRRGGGLMCVPCRVLSTRPLGKQTINSLKVRDLQHFLNRQNVSTRGCVEKEDLINLAVSHVNSTSFRRRSHQQQRNNNDFANVFVSIKGFTSNINNLINSAFETRTSPPYGTQFSQNATATGDRNASSTAQAQAGYTRQGFTPSTSGQETREAEQPNRRVQSSNQSEQRSFNANHFSRDTASQESVPRTPSRIIPEVLISPEDDSMTSDFQETDDCLEVVDVDDAHEWEFIRRPANPLPTDSTILLTQAEDTNLVPPATPTRAASELDLRQPSVASDRSDTASLKEEAFGTAPSTAKRIDIKDLKKIEDLETLNAKQLKELLALNRVDYKGCVERDELIERAKRLWRETALSREDINKLSTDELCKICMDAPLECVLLECGHIATCTSCGKRLNECPICRQYVPVWFLTKLVK